MSPHPAPTSRATVIPLITPHAQPSADDGQVVVNLTTLLTISNFSRFYPDVSLDSFRPIYYALPDGSLLAPPLLHDIRANDMFLIITGSLLSIFLRNVCKAATYLWRGKVKNKSLYYTLFLSQILGPVAVIPLIVVQFTTSANCAVVMRLTSLTSGISLSLLITGILGVKAYRCLDSNRVVLGGLLALRTAASVVLILDVINFESFRTLSGRCCRSSGLASVFIMLLLTESCFVCVCFSYAMRKSYRSLAVRGSTLHLSSDDVTRNRLVGKQSADSVRHRRGWSDVRPPVNRFSMTSLTQQPSSSSREPSTLSIRRDRSQRRASSYTPGDANMNSRRPVSCPSVPYSHMHPPVPRTWSVRVPTTADGSNIPRNTFTPFKRPTSVAHSSVSRFARCFPRMSLFREVMRDELCSTAIITAFTVVSAAMTLVGVKSASINTPIWIAFDWALISLLVVHNCGRVIRRHENELLLLHPSTWYPDIHTDRITAQVLWDVPEPEGLPRTRVRRSLPHDGNTPHSDLSTRGLYLASASSTNCPSNICPPVDIESFSAVSSGESCRRCTWSTMGGKESPLDRSCSRRSSGEWFDKDPITAPPPPEPPDVERDRVDMPGDVVV